jgi:hypothetical protein
MDLPTLAALHTYWEHSPPVHVLVARYLGIKGPTAPVATTSSGAPDGESIEGLLNMIRSGAL